MKTVNNLPSYLSIYSGVTLTAIRWLGEWTGLVPLPVERTFESLAATLEGDDKEMFLSLIQCSVGGYWKKDSNQYKGICIRSYEGGSCRIASTNGWISVDY